MASAAAAVISEIFYNQHTFIQLNEGTVWTVTNIPYYVIIGLAAGLVSAFVIRTSVITAKKFEKYKNVWIRGAVGCLILYVFFLLFPALKGEGYGYVSDLLRGKESVIAIGSPISSLFGGVRRKRRRRRYFRTVHVHRCFSRLFHFKNPEPYRHHRD